MSRSRTTRGGRPGFTSTGSGSLSTTLGTSRGSWFGSGIIQPARCISAIAEVEEAADSAAAAAAEAAAAEDASMWSSSLWAIAWTCDRFEFGTHAIAIAISESSAGQLWGMEAERSWPSSISSPGFSSIVVAGMPRH